MKIAEPYRCDGPGCAKQRESDANHWWVVRELPNGIGVGVWTEKNAELDGAKHACGVDCMTKIVAQVAAGIVDDVKARDAANGA